ncbi:HECT-domain-containing protein [Rhizopus microsporus var. microsporus]|uniref:HECT-type E3 ubiquitin transferase n=1 Tax=Rhizopus microsporus var. microsporus TaxID=86635 RepID=A0A1X0R6X8_RHIZD|nr:HECT-domain-containing protein [Rhizopus microsporus var. microsporus]
MNFTFEGNYKPRRNINLGGVKTVGDKKSLLLKAQNERKAREQERIKQRSIQQIQAFYRGRRQAAIARNEARQVFLTLLEQFDAQPSLNDKAQFILTLTRALILFYQPEKDKERYLQPYIRLLLSKQTDKTLLEDMFMIATDSWTWLMCFLIKKVLLQTTDELNAYRLLSLLYNPSMYALVDKDNCRVQILVYSLRSTYLLDYLRRAMTSYREVAQIVESIILQVISLRHPSFDVLRIITLDLFTEPFLLDNMSNQAMSDMVTQLPLGPWLVVVGDLVKEGAIKDDASMAGLLMNVTEMGYIQHGKYLDDHVLAKYAKAIQLLLSHLPVSFLTSNYIHVQDDAGRDSSDSSDEDVEMIELPTKISPLIKNRLESLYNTEKINSLLSRCMQLTATDSNAIRFVSSFINTLLLRWPMKKNDILNTLLYKSVAMQQLLQTLWQSWSASKEAQLFGQEQIIYRLNEAISLLTDADSSESWSTLYLLCEIYTRLLLTIADTELLSDDLNQHPFQLKQIIQLSTHLKTISFVMFWRADNMDLSREISHSGIQLHQLRSTITQLLQQIHMRDSRRSFCPTDHWLIKDLNTDNFSSAAVAEEFNLETDQQEKKLSKGRLAIISPRLGILNNIPFVVPFEQRVEIFQQFIQNDKKRNNIDERFRARVGATIRRDHIFEDGFNAFHKLDVGLKDKVAISFVDEFGLEEAGIDGGGVFKEFLTGLSHEAFDVNYGLFVATPEQLLYPNPNSFATESQQLEYFRFLGLIIGKAVYEGILLDVPFASFFLKKCLGKVNYLDDLSSLDPELYKGLLSLKKYDGNVEDLSLDFTVTHDEMGSSKTIELVPNGSQVPVTNQNRIQYIYLVANYRLNVQIAKQCRAFFKGLSTIVDIKWLRMFNEQELQVLLGGASIPIDLADLRANTVLAGYDERDATIQNFWKALESFDNTLRMKFVKFVTSCSRPPLLGFKELVPKFCIRNAGVDDDRLPTSSTCVNLLKLPNFSSYRVLREKLLYAITADAGFDLS